MTGKTLELTWRNWQLWPIALIVKLYYLHDVYKSECLIHFYFSDSCSKISSCWMVNDTYKAGAEHVAHHTPIENVCVGGWLRGVKQFNFLLKVGPTSRQNQSLSTGPLYLHTVGRYFLIQALNSLVWETYFTPYIILILKFSLIKWQSSVFSAHYFYF